MCQQHARHAHSLASGQQRAGHLDPVSIEASHLFIIMYKCLSEVFLSTHRTHTSLKTYVILVRFCQIHSAITMYVPCNSNG